MLSVLEVCCFALVLINDDSHDTTDARGAKLKSSDAVAEVNARLEQHGMGYRFEGRHIIRIDSQFIHAEVVKPTLKFLSEPKFSKVNEEFFRAHSHYRAAAYKDCVTAANRAFESMLKAICDVENWTYAKGDGAAELVTKVTSNGLFSHDFDRSLTAYVAMLRTGLPAIRNDAGGHREGILAAAVTEQIARFALNLTAANILFLAESHSILSSKMVRGRT